MFPHGATLPLSGLRRVVARRWASWAKPVPAAPLADTPPDARAATPPGDGAANVPPTPALSWPPDRIAFLAKLWGDGYIGPTGAEDVLRLAAPLGLSESRSLLLLGAGIGAATQLIGERCATWVDGYDLEPELVDRATRRIQHTSAALAKRATVTAFDGGLPVLRRKFDCVLTIGALRGAHRKALLGALATTLKPGGKLQLQELVHAQRPVGGAAARQGENHLIYDVPAEQEVTNALTKQKFDIRVVENESDRHMAQILRAWAQFAEATQTNKPSRREAWSMVSEAELWMHRIRLLREGQLRMVRWFALAPGPPPIA